MDKIIPSHKMATIILVGGATIAGLIIIHFTLPRNIGVDWYQTYRPATLAMLSGKSPYIVEPYFSPPWGLIPFIPFVYLPAKWGQDFLFLSGFVAYAFTAWKMGGRRIAVAVFMASPLVMHALLNANFEPWAVLGFVLPPQIGLFLIALKPQIGAGLALFWLVEALRKGGIKEVLRVFAPVVLVFLLSLVLYGLWPLRLSAAMVYSQNFIVQFWPYTLPIGLALLGAAIRTARKRFAIAAGPCLSPYALFYSWTGPLLAIIDKPLEIGLAVFGLWLVVIVQFF